MNRLFIFVVSLFLPVALFGQFRDGLTYGNPDDSPTMASLRKHVEYLSSPTLKGRSSGSEGEILAARYMYDVFREYGLDCLYGREGDIFGILQEDGDTLTSRNAAAFITGYDRTLRDHYIVIGARMDNIAPMTVEVDGEKQERIFRGANGNASGMAMLLELARMLKTNEALVRRSVILIGFGSSMQTFAGSWYFLNRSFSDAINIDAMINLDVLGGGSESFQSYSSANASIDALLSRTNASVLPVKPYVAHSEPMPSDHQAFYAKEIPSVMFTTGPYPQRGSDRDVPSILDYDSMERELEYLYNFVMTLASIQDAPTFSGTPTIRKAVQSRIVPYYECDRKPVFLGSTDPRQFLQKWVYQYLRYPKEAVSQGIQGKVQVDFIITDKGKVTDVKVTKGVHPLLDAEAVRVISASPDWTPGRVNGKKVDASMSLTVEFRLEKK